MLHSGTLHRQNVFVVAPFKFISICKQFLVLYVAILQNIIVHRSGQDHRPLSSYDFSAGAHDSTSFGRYYLQFPPDVTLPVMVDPLKMLGKETLYSKVQAGEKVTISWKERLRAKNELLEPQVKEAEKVNKSIMAKKVNLLKKTS